MKKTKLLTLLLAFVLVLSLAACGSKATETAGESAPSETTAEQPSEAPTEAPQEPVNVVIGVVGEDVEMWPPVVEKLAEQGITIELKKFDDYVIPNQALNDGDLDLNAFQHKAYLYEEIEKKGYDIVSIGETYISPMNVYSASLTSIDEVKEGDKVAIPNDVTNGRRALKVIESAGLIKLDPEKGYSPEVKDIIENTLNLEFVEVAAANIYGLLPDVAIGVINGNYALTYELDPKSDALFVEVFSGEEENPYVNVLVARTEDADNEVYKKVIEAYQSQEVIDTYNEAYQGYYLPGWIK